ncbi:Photosynthetic apparatus regulatory protein RegA [Zhongshania aliphaticivorans]|uniref:Photosynthetic apparatus regulatory protein RegA n=1 Tax=Zhongshania aliphaticivorans TaxID=1470434 RepID=A0A5S9N3M4_9GAMM|nr:response regulator transcription factor [Zhongshania aliphaticivorans]CAA0082422.1 Photosynthetic apparatus regulatory protein RegA [Zhongshania aliphaticivorans]CAA0084316.1 Photosynthetic apparatus regulatory protein RegA [Zhongshania aliphaticivorans]
MSENNNKFLLVDDDVTFTTTLCRSLKRRGYVVTVAHSVDEALLCCQTYTPDKAVIDLKLETKSGLSLIPVLRNRFPNLRMIVLTGYSSIATTVDAIKMGAENYLQKPAGTREILAAFDNQTTTEDTQLDSLSPPSLDRIEWEHIQRVLTEHNGNISETARQLGMHRRTLQRKLQKRPVKT